MNVPVHVHHWIEQCRTYALPVLGEGNRTVNVTQDFTVRCLLQGSTTILWECSDPTCRALRKEELVGKEVK